MKEQDTRLKEEDMRQAFREAMIEGARALEAGDTTAARKALWQAHQIGRNTTTLHVMSHFALLRLALRTRDLSEMWSQSWLTLGALLLTWLRPQMPRTRASG